MKSPIHARHTSRLGRYDVGAVLLIAVIGLLLAFQGWNSRLMNFDHVNFIDEADKLLSDKTLPDRGDVSSYFAWATPGTAWLMVPGMFVFEDPRLYEAVGSAALHIGTLFGLFLLARMCFGNRCAYLSLLLYGFSRGGLFNAGSLWSIGHPFFYIWTAYFLILWVQRNNANYLAAAGVTWSAGMYVDMVLAPTVFAFAAFWLIYRPKVTVAPLLLGALIVFTIWYPFLRFQSDRDFADLKAVVFRQKITQTNYKDAWCVPARVIHSLKQPGGISDSEPQFAALNAAAPSVPPPPTTLYETVKKQIRQRSAILKEAATFNFDQMTWTPLAAAPLALLSIATLALTAILPSARLSAGKHEDYWLYWIPRVAWVLLFLPVLANEAFVARFLSTRGSLDRSIVLDIRTVQVGLLLSGLTLLVWKRQIAEALQRLAAQPDEQSGDGPYRNSTLLALALVLPWLGLIMVVETGFSVRYYWLWPLQTIFIAAVFTWIPERLGWPRSVAWLGQVAIVLIMLTHPWVVTPVQEWVRTGWSGPRANDIQAIDFIAAQTQAQGKTRVAIGYQTYIAGFMAIMNVADPRYKVGAELDLFLRDRYGIANSSQCAEGVSADDEYRIVQEPPVPANTDDRPISWAPLGSEVKTYDLVEYFDVPLDPSFRMLRQFGEFQVFQRTPSSID